MVLNSSKCLWLQDERQWVYLPRAWNGNDSWEIDPGDPEPLHQHVEGLDPHDGRSSDSLVEGVDAAVGPVLRQVHVKLK